MSSLGCFPCFGAKKDSSVPAPEAFTQVIAERAKAISMELARPPVTDDELNLRLQGYEEDDPELQAVREEKIKRRSLEMEAAEAKHKSEVEHFHRRLQAP
jgi:hypothetical protein